MTPNQQTVFVNGLRPAAELSTSWHSFVLSSADSPGRIIGAVGRIIKGIMLSPFVGQTVRVLNTKAASADLEFLTKLIEGGGVAPVIERTYALGEAADAIRYLETGLARGKVVISVSAATTSASRGVQHEYV